MKYVFILTTVLFTNIYLPTGQNLKCKTINLPSKADITNFLIGRWYIVRGEGPGGNLAVGGVYEFTSTHRIVTFGRESGKLKYSILTVRPSKSGESYFFDLKINNPETGKSWFEECMIKPSGSIIIRSEGSKELFGSGKDKLIEIVRQ